MSHSQTIGNMSRLAIRPGFNSVSRPDIDFVPVNGNREKITLILYCLIIKHRIILYLGSLYDYRIMLSEFYN